MEEELKKKNNKGLIIGLILFLVICLGFSVFFIFQVISDDNTNQQSENNESETNNTEEPKEIQFTELTKYELGEAETKEITIGDNKFTLKKGFINSTEVKYNTGFYVADNLIIAYGNNQFGEIYAFYDLNLNEITTVNFDGFRFSPSLYLEEGKILVKANYNPMDQEEGQLIGNLILKSCDIAPKNSKKLSEVEDSIKEHATEVINGIYQIKYENNQVSLELFKAEQTVQQYLEESDLNKTCAVEINS